MYSNLFRGSGWGESSLSDFYTGPMFIKNDASSGTTRCWSKASCIDITNAQLQSQLMQLRKKKPEKIGGLPGLTLTTIPMQGSNQFASVSHVNGSWSLNLLVLYPGKIKMKWQIHEFTILDPWNEEINARLFLLKTQGMPAKSPAPVSWSSWFELQQAWAFSGLLGFIASIRSYNIWNSYIHHFISTTVGR